MGVPDVLGRTPALDSPGLWYALHYRRSVHQSFGVGALEFCGLRPVQFSTVSNMLHLDDQARERWLDKVEKVGKKDARRGASHNVQAGGALSA